MVLYRPIWRIRVYIGRYTANATSGVGLELFIERIDSSGIITGRIWGRDRLTRSPDMWKKWIVVFDPTLAFGQSISSENETMRAVAAGKVQITGSTLTLHFSNGYIYQLTWNGNGFEGSTYRNGKVDREHIIFQKSSF